MVINETIANEAGISRNTRSPFSSMKLDQVNGVNGILLDDKAGASAKIIKRRTLNVAGITRTAYTNTFSVIGRN